MQQKELRCFSFLVPTTCCLYEEIILTSFNNHSKLTLMEKDLIMNPAPGIKNLITDIAGIQVGHAEDNKIGTGVTVIIGDKPFSAAVDVRGGGPGTRETDMLSLENSIGRADAIVLSGGSAFGLDACSEVQDLLRQDKKGYKVGKAIIPLVPGAVIFDLNLNDKPHVNIIGEHSPWRILANKAYKEANTDFLLGSFGAGCGATTATLKVDKVLHHGHKFFQMGKNIQLEQLLLIMR